MDRDVIGTKTTRVHFYNNKNLIYGTRQERISKVKFLYPPFTHSLSHFSKFFWNWWKLCKKERNRFMSNFQAKRNINNKHYNMIVKKGPIDVRFIMFDIFRFIRRKK